MLFRSGWPMRWAHILKSRFFKGPRVGRKRSEREERERNERAEREGLQEVERLKYIRKSLNNRPNSDKNGRCNGFALLFFALCVASKEAVFHAKRAKNGPNVKPMLKFIK